MRSALHLGIRKALGVVGSHYQVDFEAVSSGYVIPIGVEDEEAMNHADTPLLLMRLPRTSWTSCSWMPPAPTTLKPEDHRESSPFYLSVSIRASWPCNVQLLNRDISVNISKVFCFACHAVPLLFP
jgi:hypothetical protein